MLLKGSLHIHTTCSDGEMTPQEVANAYAERGFDFIAFTDHDYLLKGDVFTSDVIETWISYKIENEVQAVELRPHPWEFALYYDI